MGIEELKINKIIQEYSFLKTDEQLKRELIAEGTPEFLETINRRLLNIDPGLISQPKQPEGEAASKKTKPKVDPEEVDNNTKVKLKKILREIVKLTHPDRISDERLNDIYIEAMKHYDAFDLFELYFIAKELKISIKLTLEENRILTELIEVKKGEIKNLESSFIWIWMSAEDAPSKENVVQSFIKTHYLAD